MPSSRCNTRLVSEASASFERNAFSIPKPAKATFKREMAAAKSAANRGECTSMRKHAENALRAVDAHVLLLPLGSPGSGRRRRRRR